jgi:hypothetical protein
LVELPEKPTLQEFEALKIVVDLLDGKSNGRFKRGNPPLSLKGSLCLFVLSVAGFCNCCVRCCRSLRLRRAVKMMAWIVHVTRAAGAPNLRCGRCRSAKSCDPSALAGKTLA